MNDFNAFSEGSDPTLSMVFTDPNTLSTLFKKVRFSAHFGSLLGGQSGPFSASVALSDALVATEQAKAVLSSATEPCGNPEGQQHPLARILTPGRQDDLDLQR